jgi:hypothetical protein
MKMKIILKINYSMRTTKLNYLRILQQQYNSGKISEKKYKKELKFTKTIK